MLEFLLLAAAFASAVVLTGWMRGYARRRELVDVPNARSSHQQPTPRGGGISIVAVTLCAILAAALAEWVPVRAAVALLGGGVLVALVGHLDDRRHVPARWRLLVHLVAAAWVIAWLWPLPPLVLPGMELQIGLAGAAVSALWIAWALNLYNFMDGIDGIAGVEAVSISAGAAALLLLHNEPGLAFTMAALGAAALGFLVWNWPPAKVFMGDVGSGFLGFVFGSLALVTHSLDALVPWAWLILMGVFVVDATVTVVRRLLRRERVYEAHRSHAYQRAARRFASHRLVTLSVGLINIFWLLPFALAAALWPTWGAILMILAWTPLLGLALWMGAGGADALRPAI